MVKAITPGGSARLDLAHIISGQNLAMVKSFAANIRPDSFLRSCFQEVRATGSPIISQQGQFKIFPHPQKPASPLFVFSSTLAPQADSKRSIAEIFTYYYILILKSEITDFSVRCAHDGEKPAEVDELNWRKTSQSLFIDDAAERGFIEQLLRVISA